MLAEAPTPAVKYGQGRIVGWNPDTFQNTIEWRGSTFTDLPVLSGSEALTYEQDDQVILLGFTPGDGASTWFILGRAVLPGSDAAARAISFLQTSLAKSISQQVFASQIFTGDDASTVTTTDSGYQDLGGPIVADVEIGATGRALVFLSAVVSGSDTASVAGGFAAVGGRMSFEVTGATSQSPSNPRSVAVLNQSQVAGQTATIVIGSRIGTSVVVDGLTPGMHSFRALYARLFVDTNVSFADRVIAVIAF